MRGSSYVCMTVNSRPNYTGSFYYFASRKRAADSTCEGSVAPDTLVLADGVTKYDIAGFDEAKVEELVSSVFRIFIFISCLLFKSVRLRDFNRIIC